MSDERWAGGSRLKAKGEWLLEKEEQAAMGSALEIIRPPRLAAGGAMGVAAPASPFDELLFGQGRAVLEESGHAVLCREGIYARNRYLAGTDRQRAELLQALFEDPAVGAIICARGGFGSMRLLPYLDFDRIRRHPKALVGFSDITALLCALIDRSGLVGFHGPVVTSLAETDDRTIKGLFSAVAGPDEIILTAPEGKTVAHGQVSAPVVGGNLTTLSHLLGTGFAPSFEGKILLLEDINEAPYRIDRMLSQMRLAGRLDGLAGLVLGSFNGCGSEEEIEAIVEDIFGALGIPIFSGLEVGHGPVNLTVPLGLTATLDADARRLFFHEPATVEP